jgi:hypothetical protein
LNAAGGASCVSTQENDHGGTLVAADDGITRRDFLDGVAIAVGAAASGGLLPRFIAAAVAEEAAAQDATGYYPPALTGLRGNHAGSFETAHARRRFLEACGPNRRDRRRL